MHAPESVRPTSVVAALKSGSGHAFAKEDCGERSYRKAKTNNHAS
jgi:hypothetical protein